MIKADLKAAGIPYRDDAGRVADFHSLRHSFVSSLARSDAPVKMIRTLARHSTPTPTLGVYAHVGIQDQAVALDALPAQGQPTPAAGSPAPPVGTDLALPLPCAGCGNPHPGAQTYDREESPARPHRRGRRSPWGDRDRGKPASRGP